MGCRGVGPWANSISRVTHLAWQFMSWDLSFAFWPEHTSLDLDNHMAAIQENIPGR